MALSLLAKAKQYFTSKSQDNEGWFQQTQQRANQAPIRMAGPLVVPNWKNPTGQDIYKSFGKGLVNTSTFGLIKPKYESQTPAGKFSNIVGSVAGFVNPIGPGAIAMRGIENVGSRAIAKYAPQLTKSIGGKIVGGLGKEALQTAAYTGGQALSGKLGLAPSMPITPKSVAENMLYGSVLRGAFSPQVAKGVLGAKFSMPKNTMDEVIQAEDRLLHPEKYLEKTISVTKKNGNSIRNTQIKRIQEEAAKVIDQISAKHLPNDVLEKTAGNVKAQIKALIDLNAENKLANVNYLTDNKSQLEPKIDVGEGKINVLPPDIPVYQEAKAVGMKRIAPDRVLHQKLTPDEGISALVNQQKSKVEKISSSWRLASEKVDNIIRKYGDNLPPRTSENLTKYPELSKDYSEIYDYRKYAPGAKTLTQIRDTFKNRSEMSSLKWTPESEVKAFESAKKDYIELVKKDISHGYRYPDTVLNYDPSFRKAIDSRARYEKGLYTSFSADDHRIVFDDTGNITAGMKRQDGKELLPAQKREIVNGVLQTQNALGIDLNQMSKDDRWVYAHLNGKNPFLTQQAAGLYRPGDKSVSISLGGTEIFKTLENGKEVTKRVNTTIAHELGHALDYKVKNNLIDSSTLFDLKRSYNPVEWGFRGEKYWRSSTEVTARALEEYVAVKEGNIKLFDRDGYWSKEIFESKIKPAIEGAIDNHFPQYKTTLAKPLLESSLSPFTQLESKIKQPTIKIKIGKVESKPSMLQLGGQSQTSAKQNLNQSNTSLDTQKGQIKNSALSSVAEGTPGKVSQPIISQDKYIESVNTNKLKLKPEEKKTLETATNLVKDEIQKVKGKTLSNDEVITAAKQSDVLQKVITRDQTLEAEAIQLKARQQMVSLDKEVNELSKQGNSPLLQKKIQELLESIKTVNANAADKGRQLQALSIDAGDESVRLSILKDISKIETDTEKIIRESANVDWGNANKVAEFYRKFIKPSTMETLDEYRYNNMLSSPRTHIRNAFSNLVQTFVTRPVTLAAQGKFKQTGQYYKGAIKALPDAVSEFTKAFKGETPIGKQDIKYIPTGKIPKFMTIPSKALEASDRFFTKLISGGEMARGASENEALDAAAYSLFRQGLNPEGQGKLLSAMDSLTAWTYNAPKAVRWFVPFIRTPMNFAKQWVEYSPSGFLTTIGADNKGEQIAKAFIGSTVMAVGAKFALDDNTTWSAPTDPKEKEIFYASGRKPFSVKIGDKWVSMMYAGPFALAFAIPAAAKYYQEDNRTALTDTQLQKLGKVAMSMAEYLSGQTFLEGMNNFVKFFSGDADYTFAKNMGYTAGQVIPMQGLVRWVSGIIDPVYRKATTFGDQIKSGIPGVSKSLPPYLDPTGKPSTREGYNSFTPYDITPDKSEYNKPLEERQDKLQQNAVINKAVKDMESQLQSGTDPKPVQVGNIFILPEEGEIKKIELKQFHLPEKTGDIEKDKKALSSYKSSITAQIKQVDRLIAAGAMPTDQGNELKANLTDLKNQASTISVSSGKKSTKSKGGKITIAKTPEPKVIKFKLPTIKLPANTLKSNIKVKKPSIAQLKKRRTIKIKV